MSDKNYIIRISKVAGPAPAKELSRDLGKADEEGEKAADNLEAAPQKQKALQDATLAFMDSLLSPGVVREGRYAQRKLQSGSDHLRKKSDLEDRQKARELKTKRSRLARARRDQPRSVPVAPAPEDVTPPAEIEARPAAARAALRQSGDANQDAIPTFEAAGLGASGYDQSVALQPPVPAGEPAEPAAGHAEAGAAGVHSPDGRQTLPRGTGVWRQSRHDEAALAQAATEAPGAINVKEQTLIELMRTISDDLRSLESGRRNYTGVGGGQ